MGYVISAPPRQLGTRVAMKFLHPRAAAQANPAARFLREARLPRACGASTSRG
jgi:hypothetical protein